MDSYQHQAAFLKAIAHPVRLHIVDLLRQEPECVCHLSAALDKPQPYISQQLAILRNAGVIVDEREGTNVFYGLASGRAAEQVAAILGAIVEGDPVLAERGHQHVAGCYCPKCEPDGTCSLPGDHA